MVLGGEAGEKEAPAGVLGVGEDRVDLGDGLPGAEDRLVEAGPLAPGGVQEELAAQLASASGGHARAARFAGE